MWQKFSRIYYTGLFLFLCLPHLVFADDSSSPVTVGFRNWTSRAAMANSHGRCAVRKVGVNAADQLQALSNYVDSARAQVTGMLVKSSSSKNISLPKDVLIIIPVYFHVLAYGNGELAGEVPPEMLFEQINVLNRAFDGSAGGPSTPFRFVLEDVSYTYRPTWAAISWGEPLEFEVKRTLRKGDARSLNVYTVSLNDDTLGWSTFPWEMGTANDFAMDGVAIHHETLPGGDAAPYNRGDTLVHEVGHWFGLLHTFENGCRHRGDSITDTPAEKTPAAGCPKRRNSCKSSPGRDPVSNYMDYSDDRCMFKFTPRQVSRMVNFWFLYRANR